MAPRLYRLPLASKSIKARAQWSAVAHDFLQAFPPTVLAIEFLDALPPIVIGILAILLIIFIIKSLIKFAIIAGAVILLVFILWRTGLLPF